MSEKKIMLGNEAIARGAYEAGVKVSAAYPGTPSTEISENIVHYPEIYAEWSPNEKVAMEVAIGASISGVRALASMKHVGVNVASDPLFTIAYSGVNGGLVLVAADDPGLYSSQNEQDSRLVARTAQIPVLEPSDSMEAKEFTKLAFESQFQKLSPGGAISYVEVPDMQNNLEAVLDVMKFIYDHIMYAELNTKSDFCQCCGFGGEILVVEDEDGKLVWECPNCHNRDQSKMNVARRTCGYIGTQYWNQGRTQEIKDRVLHL